MRSGCIGTHVVEWFKIMISTYDIYCYSIISNKNIKMYGQAWKGPKRRNIGMGYICEKVKKEQIPGNYDYGQ